MVENADPETTCVVICGFGPTGAMLSALLSQFAVPHVVLERDLEVNQDPRGIALDEDGIRYLQACGLYGKVFTEIGQCMGRFNFVGGREPDLSREPFMIMDYNTTEGGTGHPGFLCHKQPAIEVNLRKRIKELGVGKVCLGARVTGLKEVQNSVEVTYLDTDNKTHQVSAKIFVGADGKTGFTRKHYLEPLGISLDRIGSTAYEEHWVALNWKISLPTPETHPDFPLWAKGFSPQDVYDAFFPRDFRFICNPKRASVCGRFGLSADRLWRFEFLVLRDEDPSTMAEPHKIIEVVYPYITHSGSRYGLSESNVTYPEDCIEVLRCRPFRFSARSCNEWSLDRVVICGDAAHVFPPFGGQGIASGFRDAISLSWRLVLATQSPTTSVAVDHDKLLKGWFWERKQQLNKSLASTIRNGEYVTQSNSFLIFIRDWWLWFVQLVPSWRHTLRLGYRSEGLIRYQWEEQKSLAFMPTLGGGGNCPQVYASLIGGAKTEGRVVFTDDIIFSRSKRGLFQALILASTTAKLAGFRPMLKGITQGTKGLIFESETTVLLNTTIPPADLPDLGDVYRLATGAEFAADPVLCAARPEPIGYDPFLLAKEVGLDRIIILRPDRFVFAVCQTRAELHEASQQLLSLCERGEMS
ncbi:FAD/NAD(P)-binding domain-containing protein [Sarocladium strictum]